LRVKEWGFAAAGRDGLGRLDDAVANEQGVVEIVYCGADVAGEEIEGFSDLRSYGSFFYGHGKMLFAGGEWSKFRMAEDEAGGDAGVGGDGFVAGVAGDDAGVWVAYDAS